MSIEAVKIATPSLLRWQRSLPQWAREMVTAWLVAIQEVARTRDIGERGVASLRRACVDDVRAQLEVLAIGASRECLRAWCAWYPEYVAARLREIEEQDPALFMSEAERRELQSARDRESKREHDRVRAALKLGSRLLLAIDAQPGAAIRWEPGTLARVLAPRGPEPRLKPMAEALEGASLAVWHLTPSGKRWALALTKTGLEAARLLRLHRPEQAKIGVNR
jgi:hypothetical protein